MVDPTIEKLNSLDTSTYKLYTTIDSQYITSCLSAAAYFKIPDKLKEGPKTTEELATEHSIIPDRLFRMLRLLASSGVFSYNPNTKSWSNTELSLSLSSEYNAVNSLIESFPDFNQTLLTLLPSLRSEQSSFALTHGVNLGEYLQESPSDRSIFIKVMRTLYENQRKYLKGLLNFEDSSTILMIGVGNDTYLCDILNDNPAAKGAMLELPSWKDRVLSQFIQANLSNRAEFIEGSPLDYIPQGYDTHIIKFYLNDYSDENALRILNNSRNSISDNGKCFIIEYVITEEDSSQTSVLLNDLYLLTYSNGLERTEPEWVNLLNKARYRIEKRILLEDKLNILICIPI